MCGCRTGTCCRTEDSCSGWGLSECKCDSKVGFAVICKEREEEREGGRERGRQREGGREREREREREKIEM